MRTIVKKTITLFVQGLLTLLPLLVTIYVLYLVISFVEGLADNLLGILPDEVSRMWGVRGILKGMAIVVFFSFITFFGLMMRTVLGKALVKWMDAFFEKLPGLNSVYAATHQVVDVFRSGKKQFFTNPVLAEYPSAGIWSMGFNTGEMEEARIVDDRQKRFTIFIPTTPNPTSGFLAVLSESQIRKLDITVEDAIKMILTGGMVKRDHTDHHGHGNADPLI